MTKFSVTEQKSDTRERHHAIRRSLQSGEWKQKSESITDRLLSSEEFKSSNAVHTYVSIEKNREVNTIEFIDACFDAGKMVIVPRMKSDSELTHHKITSTDTLKENNWGVHESTGNEIAQLPDGLIVIVPMVAADFRFNRLGYGKGYYDRFLSNVNAIKIGLCFNCNLCWRPLPVETFDIKMDAVITNQFAL